MKTLLVVDDQEIFRTPLALALRTRGFTVLEASDGASALVHADRGALDLALIDINMPDMDGISVVRALRAKPSTGSLPVILVTAQARREDIAAGTTMGVRDFLLKSSFSLNDLVDRIQSRIATAIPAPPAPPASLTGSLGTLHPGSSMRSGTTGGVASSAAGSSLGSDAPVVRAAVPVPGRSKALPTPVAEILAIASSNTASLEQVQAVVRRDPILAERIISSASAVGNRGTAVVESLEDALRVMGLEQLVRIVASVPVVSADDLAGRNGQELSQIWTHGLATALLCERLAPSQDRTSSFLAGLFHVLPALLGVQSLGEEWPAFAANARKEGSNGIEAVASAFGRAPGTYAEEVLAGMRLPESIASVVREWHRDKFRRGTRAAGEACRRLDAASSLASALGFPWDDLSSVRPITGEETRSWSDPETLLEDVPRIRREIRVLQDSAGLPRPPDASVLAGLWGSEEILYWRDARFRAPDPIELALVGREVRREESPERLLLTSHPMAVACAEPGSPWWNSLMTSPEPLLIVHCGNAPPSPSQGKVRLVQAPVPLYLLTEAVGGA
jgi:two-component system chemotaxis response regulator CheY